MKYLLVIVVTIGISLCMPYANTKADELTDEEFAEKVLEALRGAEFQGEYDLSNINVGQPEQLEKVVSQANPFINTITYVAKTVWKIATNLETLIFLINHWDRLVDQTDSILPRFSVDDKETVKMILERCTPSNITVNSSDGDVKIECIHVKY